MLPEEPWRSWTCIPLACTHHPCPQCPVHSHKLLLPPAPSWSTGQAGWGSSSRRLVLGVCATVSLHHISHHTWAFTTCFLQPGKGTCGARCSLELKWEDGQQSPWVFQKYFTYQTTRLLWAGRPLAERNCGAGNLDSFHCAHQAVAKTKAAVPTCEKTSDKRPNRPSLEEE